MGHYKEPSDSYKRTIMKKNLLIFAVIILQTSGCSPKLVTKFTKNNIQMERINIKELERVATGKTKIKPNQSVQAHTRPDSVQEMYFMEKLKDGESRIALIKRGDIVLSFTKIVNRGEITEVSYFYPDGTLKEHTTFMVTGGLIKPDKIHYYHVKVGTKHFFDEKGNVSAIEDIDKIFPFSLGKVLEYAKNSFVGKRVEIYQMYILDEVRISKGWKQKVKTNHPYWRLRVEKEYRDRINYYDLFILDGISGEVIHTALDWIQNQMN